MPYNSVKDLPANVKKLPVKRQRQWMHIWNSAYARAIKAGKSPKSAETTAFAQANGVVLKNVASEASPDDSMKTFLSHLYHSIKDQLTTEELSLEGFRAAVARARGHAGGKARSRNRAAGEVREFAVWTTKFVNDLPDSSFLYIESGGEKDAEGRTTPRTLRHFPYKNASGDVDLPHLRNAIARIPQAGSWLSASQKDTLQRKAQALLSKAKAAAEVDSDMFWFDDDGTSSHESFVDYPYAIWTLNDVEYLIPLPEEFAEGDGSGSGSDDGEAPPSDAGFMIGIELDPVLADALALPEGEAPEDLHITISYCGRLADLDPLVVARAIVVAESCARWRSPLQGQIAGVGRFLASDSSDGMDVLYASVDIPGLNELKTELDMQLCQAGCEPSREHGYTPHVTLDYLDPAAATPAVEIKTYPIRVSALTVFMGDQRIDLPLGTNMPHEVPLSYAAEPVNLAKLCSNPQSGLSPRLFFEFDPSKIDLAQPFWLQVLPPPGQYNHPSYGLIDLTEETNREFVTNATNHVYQEMLPIDAEHRSRLSGAYAWMDDWRLNADFSVDAHITLTERGRASLAGDSFRYFSPEWFDDWTDPQTDVTYHNILLGGAFTTRPFFKSLALRPLVATEQGLISPEEPPDESVEEGGDMTVPAATAGDPTTQPPQQTAPPNPSPQSVQMSEEQLRQFTDMQDQLRQLTERDAAREAELSEARQASERRAEELKQANERLGVMELDARTRRFTAIVEGHVPDGARWFGEVEKHVARLHKLSVAFGEDSEDVVDYIAEQTAVAKQLAESELLKEKGTTAPPSDDSSTAGRIAALTHKYLSEHPDQSLSYPQAQELVVQQNPGLYAEYITERREEVS